MRKGFVFLIFLTISKLVFAQNEIGPDGDKLLYILLVVVLIVVLWGLKEVGRKNNQVSKHPFFQMQRVQLTLEKDKLYYPKMLKLTVKNVGNTDVDLEKPLLIFYNFWFKRKFRIKGMENRTFYPLYLEKGKTHTLEIEISRFYQHDKSLKKFPKARIEIDDVKGKKLGKRSILLRKTLLY